MEKVKDNCKVKEINDKTCNLNVKTGNCYEFKCGSIHTLLSLKLVSLLDAGTLSVML